ncbi:hypothetical protein [Sporosarcina sp. G11-34]|uniref:hypothetical protein n=1 Tax=Sporosarcina sp. G11-34 TaxID=2849605 RepID=UPI0022A9D598|nr:hypothetical protein [Sporosarcina sp. G11-34]MCZ2258977.1 hypothetical protein [Sporosarcina sp. G11-34]
MEGIIIRRLALLFVISILLSGCFGDGDKIDFRIHNSTDEEEKNAEGIFMDDNRLTDVVAIFNKKDLIAGVSVKTFQRFKKAKIEKELKDDLEKVYPELDIVVSADSKIVMEIKKILEMKDKKDIGEKVKKLKSLVKEET